MQISKLETVTDQIVTLLQEHHALMMQYSPPESVHALNTDSLHSNDLTFWQVAVNGKLAGCGALKVLSKKSGEIKAMKTAPGFIRKGVAASILKAIMQEAKDRSYNDLFLETGSTQEFEPARKLYTSFGFEFCGPFGDYQLDPHSVFLRYKMS